MECRLLLEILIIPQTLIGALLLDPTACLSRGFILFGAHTKRFSGGACICSAMPFLKSNKANHHLLETEVLYAMTLCWQQVLSLHLL